MKKVFSKFKGLSRKAKVIVSTICIALVVGIVTGTVLLLNAEPHIEDNLYGTTIRLNELPSIEIEYPGLLTYTDGSIPILTKKSFYMSYKATVSFGVKDLSDVDIRETSDTITFTVPHSEMLNDFVIDEDSIEFTSKDLAIFNWKSVNDAPKAISKARSEAKKDVEDKFDFSQAIEDADRNISDNLKELFEQTGKTVIVNFK